MYNAMLMQEKELATKVFGTATYHIILTCGKSNKICIQIWYRAILIYLVLSVHGELP